MKPNDDLLKLARWMWSEVHDHHWKANEFRSCFNQVYFHTDDVETLWQLGGATNDYIRFNPGDLLVPIGLPKRLLISDHREARVIGLKLLNRCGDASIAEVAEEIARALERGDRYEDYGGLYELGNLIDRYVAAAKRLPENVVNRLISAIKSFAVDKDKNDQRVVELQVGCLRSLAG